MSIKTRSEKEKEIAEEIERRAGEGELSSLKYDYLVEDLSDEHYKEDQIREILDDLVEESPFDTDQMDFTVVYPESQEDELFDKFELEPKYTIVQIFGVGAYIVYGLIVLTHEINEFFSMSDAQLVSSVTLGIVFSYLFGTVALSLKDKIEMQIPIVRQYRIVVYPFIGLVALSAGLVAVTSTVFGKEIPLELVGMIPIASFGAAVAFASFVKRSDIQHNGGP